MRQNHEDGIIVGRHSLLRYDVQIPGRAWPWDGVGTLGPQHFEPGETVKIGFLKGNPQLPFIFSQKPWPQYSGGGGAAEPHLPPPYWSHFLATPSRGSQFDGVFLDPLADRYRHQVMSGSQNHWPVVRTQGQKVYVAKRALGVDTLGRYHVDTGALEESYLAGGGIVEMVFTNQRVYIVERSGIAAHNLPYLGPWWAAGSVDSAALVASRIVCLHLNLQWDWASEWMTDGVILGEPSLFVTGSKIAALSVVQVGRCLYPHQMIFDAGTGVRTSVVRLAYQDPPQPILSAAGLGPGPSPSDTTERRGLTGSISTKFYSNFALSGFTFYPRIETASAGKTWESINWHATDPTPEISQDFSRAHENWLISAGVHVPTGARRQVCGFSIETGARLWSLSESSGNVMHLYYPIVASGNKLLIRQEAITFENYEWLRWASQADFSANLAPSMEMRGAFVADVSVFYRVLDITTGVVIRERKLNESRITSKETIPHGPCGKGHLGGSADYYALNHGSPSIGNISGLQGWNALVVSAYSGQTPGPGRLPFVSHGVAFNSGRTPPSIPEGGRAHCPARIVNVSKDAPLVHSEHRASVSHDGSRILFEPQRLAAPANRGFGLWTIADRIPAHQWLGSDYYYYERNWVVCYDWELNEVWRYQLRGADDPSLGCWSTNIVCGANNRATLVYTTSTTSETGATFQKSELVELDISTGHATQVRPYWALGQIGPGKSVYLDQQTLWATDKALITRDTAQTGLVALNKPE